MNIRPVQNIVCVRLPKGETVRESGIILPDVDKARKPLEGTVVSVGPGKLNKRGERIPMDVSVGDTVLVSAGMGITLHEGGDSYLMIRERDIQAITGGLSGSTYDTEIFRDVLTEMVV